MKKLRTLRDLLITQLQDLYNAERQIVKALPKLSKAANHKDLKIAFDDHLDETDEQIERLEKIARILQIKLEGKKCVAMKGLIEEAHEVLDRRSTPYVLDAALIAAAQRMEHYEIACYGCARAFAKSEGLGEVAELLEESEEEESDMDSTLSQIAERSVNKDATEQEESRAPIR